MNKKAVGTLLVITLAVFCIISARAQSTNGVASSMPAYFNGQLFTINFTELPSGGELANLTFNSAVNLIYRLPESNPFPFVSVINEIQGAGFNPLWQEVDIQFVTISPTQFTSEAAILAAAAAGEINLVSTKEVYRCAVIGVP